MQRKQLTGFNRRASSALALLLAALPFGPAAGSMQGEPAPPVSGGSLSLPPVDNCFGDNAERYPFSSRCDPAENAKAEIVLDALRKYYDLIGGTDSEEVRMLDQLRAQKLLRFHPSGQMPNGDLGNFVPGVPRGVIRINSDWLARLEENSRRMPPMELFADLAGTIYHENIHRNQNVARYAYNYASETQAWENTLNRMARWIDGQMRILDTLDDPETFNNARGIIDGLFAAWLNKAGPELFDMVNKGQINRLNFIGPCGINGSIIGDAKLNVARNAIKACRERLRRRLPPGAAAPAQPEQTKPKRPLDELIARVPYISIAEVADADLGRVCNTSMSVDRDLLTASGRSDLSDVSKYPFVRVESAEMVGGACQMRVTMMGFQPPGVTLSCTVKSISWNSDAGVAIAQSLEGGRCQ